MGLSFSDIPDVVIAYVRKVFEAANDKASRALTTHPSMYEETLDHILIMELTAAPPAFFSADRIGLSIESHWLGNRWMVGRWEIADIAFFVLLRKKGHLEVRKAALLQTKRLYSHEIHVAELDEADYRIGIGRLVDRTEPLVPLSSQRAFSFDKSSVCGAMRAGHPQTARIDQYMQEHQLQVYYGLYNPITLPYQGLYPATDGSLSLATNTLGCRIIPASDIHSTLANLEVGQSPRFDELTLSTPLDPADRMSVHGWRLEKFVADEVLRCRQGTQFDDVNDPNLQRLLYERSAPISAAITITIDFGAEARE